MDKPTMTVSQVRKAIREADFIFAHVNIYPTKNKTESLKIGKNKAGSLFRRMRGGDLVIASYNDSEPNFYMLFIG